MTPQPTARDRDEAEKLCGHIHATHQPGCLTCGRNVCVPCAAIAQALADRDAEAEALLRETLWHQHGCVGLYGDDGEMQCNAFRPPLDFKRDALDELRLGMGRHQQQREGAAEARGVESERRACWDIASKSGARIGADSAADVARLIAARGPLGETKS
jgi:hypothetical protein